METTRKSVSDLRHTLLTCSVDEGAMSTRTGINQEVERINSPTLYQRTWQLWDDTFRKLSGIKPSVHDDSLLFCIKQRRYSGPSFSVHGVTVQRNDLIIELHMNNHCVRKALCEEQTLMQLGRRLLNDANWAFQVIANCIAAKEFERAKVLYGVTMIHRGVQRFGFEVMPIPNKITEHVLTWYLRNLLTAFNPTARSVIKTRPQAFVPKRVVMSKEQFIQNFGSGTATNLSQRS